MRQHEETKALALGLEKVPIEVRDSPGFITNRVLIPMLNEAVFALMEGVFLLAMLIPRFDFLLDKSATLQPRRAITKRPKGQAPMTLSSWAAA